MLIALELKACHWYSAHSALSARLFVRSPACLSVSGIFSPPLLFSHPSPHTDCSQHVIDIRFIHLSPNSPYQITPPCRAEILANHDPSILHPKLTPPRLWNAAILARVVNGVSHCPRRCILSADKTSYRGLFQKVVYDKFNSGGKKGRPCHRLSTVRTISTTVSADHFSSSTSTHT